MPTPTTARGPRCAPTPTTRSIAALVGAGVLLIAASYGLGRYAYGFFVPVFRAEFDLDGAQIGAIAAGSYAAYCVSIVVSTLLTPRWGARAVAVAAGAVSTGGILVVALAPDAAVLTVGVIVAGSSTGLSSPPLAEAVTRTAPAAARDRVQTTINSATSIGIVVIAPVALLTGDRWRAAWIAFAVVCAAVTVFVAVAVPSTPRRTGDRLRRPRPFLPPRYGRLVVAAALFGAGSAAVLTFGRDALVTVGGMDDAASTAAWVLLGAAGVVGVATGDLKRRLGLGRAWVLGMFTMGAATALLLAFPRFDLVAWVAIAAFGAVYMILSGILLIWATEVSGESPATGVGLAFLALALGQAAAAPVVGSPARP